MHMRMVPARAYLARRSQSHTSRRAVLPKKGSKCNKYGKCSNCGKCFNRSMLDEATYLNIYNDYGKYSK